MKKTTEKQNTPRSYTKNTKSSGAKSTNATTRRAYGEKREETGLGDEKKARSAYDGKPSGERKPYVRKEEGERGSYERKPYDRKEEFERGSYERKPNERKDGLRRADEGNP
ncbi:MAG: hypothetical protein LBC13_00325, partial [Clostridiales bacterium]|nr:hypothetical protein [Clostridiales bacterium]